MGLHSALMLRGGGVPIFPLQYQFWPQWLALGSLLGRLRAAANRVARLVSRRREAIGGACERIRGGEGTDGLVLRRREWV